jgi:hypothetical protein
MVQKLTLIVSAVVTLACVPAASAQDIWTASGVTGTVDPADAHLATFNGTGSVSMRSSIASGTLDIRFPMHSLGTVGLSDCMMLRARLRDTGAGARVLVRFVALDITTGERTSLGQIDSNTVTPPADPRQYALYQRCINVDKFAPFDFIFFTYYVEAQLIKTAAAANPGLMAVQVCTEDRCSGAGR